MLDTITLTIPEDSFSIQNHNKFNPSTLNLFRPNFYRLGARSNFSCVQNPSKSELQNGNYKPRLKVTKRMKNGEFQITLKIEFSIPKLLFGNNFDEIEEADFYSTISVLNDRLKSMGVFISSKNLIESDVSAVHFSKNIPLTDYATPSIVFHELSKLNLNKKLDMNQTEYRNEGHCLKFRCNSFEIVFYDKLRDLEKARLSEKRAIEKDNTIQFDLFQEIKHKKPFEVIRMEVRLNSRAKLKQILKKIGIQNDLKFLSIFNKSVSQNILLYFFSLIENDYSFLSYKPDSAKEFLAELKIENPKIKLRKSLQMLGLKTAMEEMGIRELREVFKDFGNINWYRLKKEYTSLKFPVSRIDQMDSIKKGLIDFQTIKPSALGKYSFTSQVKDI